jgi:hypothetical protein
MSWEGLSCVKWFNQCPVEFLIIREAWTGVTDRFFQWYASGLSTVPRDKYVVGRLELCEIIKPVPRRILDNTGSLNWCDWSFFQWYASGLSTVPRDKYVVGRLELCEMIKPGPRGMFDNTGSLVWMIVYSVMKMVLSTAHCGKDVVVRLELFTIMLLFGAYATSVASNAW